MAKPKVKPEQLEKHRKRWAGVARKNGWYKKPFFVQVWVDSDGNVKDSVSFDSIKYDIIERG